jgi:cytochrome c oxidase subunit 4
MSSEAGHHKAYYATFGALVVFTALTVALSYVTLGHVANIVVGVLIAATKAAIVALFFMHLKGEERWIFTIALFPLALVAVLSFALMPDVGYPLQP